MTRNKMNNPATIKRRKKLRIARHKREAIRHHNYVHSEKYEEDFIRAIKEFVNKQVDMPSEFAQIVNENYRELLY